MFADYPKLMLIENTLVPSGIITIIIPREEIIFVPGQEM